MSEILAIAHDMARDLVQIGAMDEITMRKLDALCLPPKQPGEGGATDDTADQ